MRQNEGDRGRSEPYLQYRRTGLGNGDRMTAVALRVRGWGPRIPPGMPSPPSFRKSNPADMPLLFMGLTSSTLPMWVVDDYAETLVAQRISTISGVAQVLVSGAQKYAVHVQVDPNKLAARGIGINDERQLAERAPELSDSDQAELRRAMRFDEVFGDSSNE